MTSCCLDTNTCVYALRGTHPKLVARFADMRPDDIAIPAMVRAELLHGALKSNHPKRTRTIVEQFFAPYAVVPFDAAAADQYATIKRDLERAGQVIGPNDLVIAATVRSRNLTLVTCNTNEFNRVPGLMVEDWTTD